MCSRCLPNSNSSVYVLKRSIVLLWWFWISFLFVFIKACSHDATCIVGFLYYYAETKEMIHESVNLKGVVYEPKQNSFSIQSFTKSTGFANVGPALVKFIDWALNKFSIKLSRKLVQSSVYWFYKRKSYYSQRIFINDFIDSNNVMQNPWQTGVANARLEFSREVRFQIFTQKWLLGNTECFVSFKIKSLKWNGFRQNITLSKHWPSTSKLFESLGRFLKCLWNENSKKK